ncbi:hypothetical protein QBC34DRAFT_189868 [Podospora aff. communis PSN243]|uniref:Rho-GAP domain-containing protein n=1 Tax=Podospora aff. communis PSN243 TaxID=3040156 RepID=A0AAV9H3Y6_9PEZI|nr:hypothetical protein QBC34DRAFT_189868 [Podospora aff. communis PSN243]
MQPCHARDMDGACQTSLRTPSSNRSTFTSRRYSGTKNVTGGIPHSATVGQLPGPGPDRRANKSSATWTSSSGDLAALSDSDEVQERPEFVQEYNRLARKHGIRTIATDDHSSCLVRAYPSPRVETPSPLTLAQGGRGRSPQQQRRGWFSRTFLRQPSTGSNASSVRLDKRVRHKRSVSDFAMHIVQLPKRDSLKDEDLQSLVRLCGKSMLYLPSEYAPSSLILPTCFRATAQYLVQHATGTRGVFRIPGSVRVVNALYDYYCADGDADEISSTTRCPNLPTHIKAGTHDVASVFKRFLSGLPGGILGSLVVFDALVAIHSQLKGDPEFTRTRMTKLRARLIALAVGSIKSQYRRELICAVFGLLCLIGRTAETAPREDEQGRPLPTADLMGYNALGIVFGPLLTGDLINAYTMRIANPPMGLALFHVTPPQARREKRKSKMPEEDDSRMTSVDNIHVANSITEMLITHWREVVKQMRSLGSLKLNDFPDGPRGGGIQEPGLRPSASESFVMRKPAEWSCTRPLSVPRDMSESPIPPSPTPEARQSSSRPGNPDISRPSLVVQRARPKGARSLSNSRGGTKPPVQFLSPTAEEPPYADSERPPKGEDQAQQVRRVPLRKPHHVAPMMEPRLQVETVGSGLAEGSTQLVPEASNAHNGPSAEETTRMARKEPVETTTTRVPSHQRRLVVSRDSIRFADELSPPLAEAGESVQTSDLHAKTTPPRLSLETTVPVLAAPALEEDHRSRRSTESVMSGPKEGRFKTTISKLRKSLDQAGGIESIQRPQGSTLEERGLDHTSSSLQDAETVSWNEEPKPGGSGLRRSRLPTYKPNHPRGRSSRSGSPSKGYSSVGGGDQGHEGLQSSRESLPTLDSPEPKVMRVREGQPRQGIATAADMRKHPSLSAIRTKRLSRSGRSSFEQNSSACRGVAVDHPEDETRIGQDQDSSVVTAIHEPNYIQSTSGAIPSDSPEVLPEESVPGPPTTPELEHQHSPAKSASAIGILSTPPSPSPSRSLQRRQSGSAVKAMAAKFENASKETGYIPSPMRAVFKPNSVLSRYTVNPSSSKNERDQVVTLCTDFSTRQSGPHNSMNMDGESVWREEVVPDEDVPDDDSSEGQWIKRNVAPSRREESLSLRTISKSSRETNPECPGETSSATLKPAMKAVFQAAGGSPKRSREPERRTQAGHRVVSFSNTTESRSVSRGTLNSELSCQLAPLSEADMPEDTLQIRETSGTASGTDDTSGSPRGKLILHAQIRSLQRQVAVKTTEVQQLQRMMDAGQDADIIMLREQLRVTERECAMWRERAEEAEKKIELFKRLSARLRKPSETEDCIETSIGSGLSVAGTGEPVTGDGALDDGNETGAYLQMGEIWLDGQQRESSAEHTEDEATVTKRIRKSFQGMGIGSGDMESTSDPFQDGQGAVNQYRGMEGYSGFRVGMLSDVRRPPQVTYQPSYRSSASEEGRRLSATVASMWMEAERMLGSEQSPITGTRSKRTC